MLDFHLFGWNQKGKVKGILPPEPSNIFETTNINLPDINWEFPPLPEIPEYHIEGYDQFPTMPTVMDEMDRLFNIQFGDEIINNIINNVYAMNKHDHSADTISKGGKLSITTTDFGSGVLKMVYDTDGYYPEVS